MEFYYPGWDTGDDNSIRFIVDVQWDGHCGYFQNGQCSGQIFQKIDPKFAGTARV